MTARAKVRWVTVYSLIWHEEQASPEALRSRNGKAHAVVDAFFKLGKALRVVPSQYGNGIAFQARRSA